MAGLLKRLIKKTAQKATKKVVKKKPTVKPTVGTQRRAVRTKATKASKTKVQTAPASRRVGTKATLNGKPVYWGGKDWGWQSKASLTKITDGTKKTPPAKPNTTNLTKPKHSTAPPKKGDGPKGTRDSASGSKTITAKGSEAQKLRKRAAAKRTSKSKVNTRLRTEEGSGSKIAVAPGVKKTPGAKKSGTKTTQLTKAQRDRRTLTNKRDIGAKAAADKTPKSTSKTTSQAGGPVNKGRDVKNSTDITAKQRDGQSTKYGTAKKPKATNAPQIREGKVRDNSRVDAREAVDSFKSKASKVIKERVDKKEGREASRLRQTLTRKAKQSEKKIKSAAEAASKNSQVGSKNNVSSSASNPTINNRDWRNRMTDSKVKTMSEQMTQQLSGKKVRTDGEVLQSPKGRGQSTQKQDRSATTRSKSGTGSYSAKGSGGDTPASTRNRMKIAEDKSNLNDKARTINRKDGSIEAKVPLKPRANKANRSDTASTTNADKPKKTKRPRHTGPLEQGPTQSPARTGGRQSSTTEANIDAERKREQKAMKALRERNLKARKAEAEKTSKLRSAATRRNPTTRSRMQIKGKD